MRIRYEQEKDIISNVLISLGANEEEARVSAEVLSEGDLRGFTSHGISRLSNIIRKIKSGKIKTNVEIKVTENLPAVALVDGNHGLGHRVALEAMKITMQKAKSYGISSVGVHNTSHFGIAGYYAEHAMKENLIGIVSCTTDPMVHPFGGGKRLFGTNPIAIGIPHKKHPILLDMATSTASAGKIGEFRRMGKEIPAGWGVDKNGTPTTIPKAALAGALSPFGGHKGSGLSFIIAILAGPLVKAEYGGRVKGDYKIDEYATKGDFMITINPEAFISRKDLEKHVEHFVDELKSSPKAAGSDEILYPGEREYRTRRDQLETGINLPDWIWSDVEATAKEFGLEKNLVLT